MSLVREDVTCQIMSLGPVAWMTSPYCCQLAYHRLSAVNFCFSQHTMSKHAFIDQQIWLKWQVTSTPSFHKKRWVRNRLTVWGLRMDSTQWFGGGQSFFIGLQTYACGSSYPHTVDYPRARGACMGFPPFQRPLLPKKLLPAWLNDYSTLDVKFIT